MALNTPHPQYTARAPDWRVMRDTFEGQRVVKERGIEYLPPTEGQELDGMGSGSGGKKKGQRRYDAYLERAVFYDVVEAAVTALVGVMHLKPASIDLPASMEPLRDKVTKEGEGLLALLRKINSEQLLIGRVGILAEVPDGKPVNETLPFLITYSAETILNWDDGRAEDGVQQLIFAVLDESELERRNFFEWVVQNKYRLLLRGPLPSEGLPVKNTDGTESPAEPVAGDLYRAAVIRELADPTTKDMMTPSIGGKTLDEIPFVFVGHKDLVAAPDKPPMLALSNLAISIYRQDADYKQALHEVCQDTLVVTGVDKPDTGEDARTGAGSALYIPNGGDAKFVGISGAGIPEMSKALQADKEEAARMGGRMLDAQGGGSSAESGDALRIRVSAKTASLANIAMTGAAALERILRIVAKWMGANPEEVVVKPNMDFAGNPMLAAELVALVTAKTSGAPLSWKTIHDLMMERGMTELDWDGELEQIQTEEDDGIGLSLGVTPAVDPFNPVDEQGNLIAPGQEPPPPADGKTDNNTGA